MWGEQRIKMLIKENDIGKIFINVEIMKSIITNFASKFPYGELLNVDITQKNDNAFFMRFKYTKNNSSSLASQIKSFSKKMKKFIFNNFGIQHVVLLTEMGF
jgi:hypothetical protein